MDALYEKCFARLRELLALEYNCGPEDFLRRENLLTVPALNPGRRIYEDGPYYFHMATVGGNAVVTADPVLHPFLEKWMGERPGHWLFELPNLKPLERELEKRGYDLTQSYHMFLPRSAHRKAPQFDLHWYDETGLKRFYGDPRFPNAIMDRFHPERPDRIAVCAYEGEKLMGMAGCSEDAPGWMQIGVDVLPEYRSRGVGTGLVRVLRCRVLEQGQIPFYGTSLSNLHSWNVAVNSGFRPAWVEIGAKKRV